eukprot:3169179-Rhodomonas_salina.1
MSASSASTRMTPTPNGQSAPAIRQLSTGHRGARRRIGAVPARNSPPRRCITGAPYASSVPHTAYGAT